MARSTTAMRLRRATLATLIAAIAALSLSAPAGATIPSGNLVVNGGAEIGPSSGSVTADRSPPGQPPAVLPDS